MPVNLMRKSALLISLLLPAVLAQPVTHFGPSAGEYGRLLEALHGMLAKRQMKKVLGGKERLVFVRWLRDQTHVAKAMKYWAADVGGVAEFFLENQTSEGMIYDYFCPLDYRLSYRLNLFAPRYWKVFSKAKLQMHRLPVEADVEYLAVEGVYYGWQTTGDKSFLRQWLPSLEKALSYSMTDPLRWSKRFHLVKRGYTIDTWDFMQLPARRKEYTRQGGDVTLGIMNVDENTPMGIMHGDNSGMYAACRQLAVMHRAVGHDGEAEIWDKQAELFRLRTNRLCWNGKFYSHFVEDDPQPPYLHMDQRNTLSLSNSYDINRGLPTEEMAQSIIQTYLELREKTKADSFAEWYGIYPPVKPHFADMEPGTYVNGAVLTIVAGELAKAAFQHGYEEYGADILRRVLKLVDEHGGQLPCTYRPDGAVDSGIPDNWGQAAVASALIEGLAGVVDRGALFESVEISPRWIAAGVDNVDVTVAYPPSGKHVSYEYVLDRERQEIRLALSGDASHCSVRVLLPDGITQAAATVNGKPHPSRGERLRDSQYLVLEDLPGRSLAVAVSY